MLVTLLDVLIIHELRQYVTLSNNQPEIYTHALARMQSRIDNLDAFIHAFVKASGPEKIEFLTSELVSSLLTGGSTKLAFAIHNYYRFGMFSKPPVFHITTLERINRPLPRYELLSVHQVRNLISPADYIYAIMEDGTLLISRVDLDVPIILPGGITCTFGCPAELVKLKPVIAAGNFSTELGAITDINAIDDYYLPKGNYLKPLVERTFQRHGFDEANGKFYNKIIPKEEYAQTSQEWLEFNKILESKGVIIEDPTNISEKQPIISRDNSQDYISISAAIASGFFASRIKATLPQTDQPRQKTDKPRLSV